MSVSSISDHNSSSSASSSADKTVLITGATDGIGKATALFFAEKYSSLHLLLHGRSSTKCAELQHQLANLFPHVPTTCYLSDFSRLSTVFSFARSVASSVSHLDVLINNAGVFSPSRHLTADGFELTFQVNYLAHFLLTRLLLPLLARAPNEARILHVSSAVHARSINFDNLQGELQYDGYYAYSLSKLCNILFSNYLHRQDYLAKHNITTNALHPGVIRTKLLHSGWGIGGEDPSAAAARLYYLAFSPTLNGISGNYYENNRAVRAASIAYDSSVQWKLWEHSSRLLHLPSDTVIAQMTE